MLRAFRRMLLLLAVAAIGGGGLVTLTTKPKLESADTEIRQFWATLRPTLDDHYKALGRLDDAMTKSGRTVSLHQELAEAGKVWSRTNLSLNDQLTTANRLEGLGARYSLIVAASPRYTANPGVVAAANAFQSGSAAKADIEVLNASIDRANALRDGALRRIVADATDKPDHPHLFG